MKTLLTAIVISIIFFLSCQRHQVDNHLMIFEDAIGKELTTELNTLLSEFEIILERSFPNKNLEDAYKQLILNTENHEMYHKFWGLDKSLVEDLITNAFEGELHKEVLISPLSIEFIDSALFVKFQYVKNNTDDTITYHDVRIFSQDYKTRKQMIDTLPNADFRISLFHYYEHIIDFDSVIKAEKSLYSFNENGIYLEALNQIKNRESFLNDYIDIVNMSGRMGFEYFGKGIIPLEPDFSDNLLRRIILIEYIY